MQSDLPPGTSPPHAVCQLLVGNQWRALLIGRWQPGIKDMLYEMADYHLPNSQLEKIKMKVMDRNWFKS